MAAPLMGGLDLFYISLILHIRGVAGRMGIRPLQSADWSCFIFLFAARIDGVVETCLTIGIVFRRGRTLCVPGKFESHSQISPGHILSVNN